MLTVPAIRAIKPQEKTKRYPDAKRMYLEVTPKGGMYWRMKYDFGGKEKLLAIGVYPEVTLAEARVMRDDAKKLIKQGVDPNVAKKEAKVVQSGLDTFKALATAWMQDREGTIKPATMTRDLSTFEKDLFPSIGDMPIDTIKGFHVLAAAKKIEERGAVEMAKRSIPLAGAIFRYAIREGLIEYDPTPNLGEALKTRKVKHFARIQLSELPSLLQKIDGCDGEIITKSAMKILCLTFVRTIEMRFMEWSEIDLNNKEWRIPAEKMKMGLLHIVPLSDQAIAILNDLKPFTGHWKYVFFNHSSHKPLSENAVLGALWRMGYKGRMTGHGFRGLASTTLHEQGKMHDAIEIQLAHTVGNAVSAAYNSAQHLPYRRTMMQDWANFLDEQRGGQVVSFPKKIANT
jgi:integrase